MSGYCGGIAGWHRNCADSALNSVPIQLLAYHVACGKGTDVDQPRNLAKSVTVE
jgi:glutamine---fructose-6-phosphate transaminase (isomerizing)